MRTITCLLTLTVTACATRGADDEEPLIEPRSVELSPAEQASRARFEERRRAHTETPADKVVAMPLSSKALDGSVVGSLDRLLVTRLADENAYEVITPADIGSLLGVERLKDAAGCNDVTCAADFAGALDARFVLYGVIDELGGRLNITLSLVDALGARVEARSQVTVDKDERVFGEAIDAAVARLLGDTGAPASISAARLPDDRAPMKLHPSATGPIFVDIPEKLTYEEWSGSKTVNLSSRDAESVLIGQWTQVGFEALDRVVVGEPSLARLKELGAVYWIVGDATTSDTGTIMGTAMHAYRAHMAVRVIELATGKVLATVKESASAGHIDREGGVRTAVDKVATECSNALLQALVAHLQASL